MTDTRPFWHPDRHADRQPLLWARTRIKRALRHWFEAQGFTEVDTACLQVSPGNETHLHAFQTAYETESGTRTPLYLHTSPEFAMKKLLAAGERKLFTFAPVFRNGEQSRLHAPEFMMLEWYRTGEPYQQLMQDCTDILAIAASITGNSLWTHNNRACDVGKPCNKTTLYQAFSKFADLPLQQTLRDGVPDLATMRRETARIGVRVAPDDTWSDLFSRVLTERIEPNLGTSASEMLIEYPTHEAALARPHPDDPTVAERFEMYISGVELANGFGELRDADEQRRRFESEMAEKKRIYGRTYPIDEDFLAALEHMPAASGCALGFDRLVMLATGAPSVAHVQWTPVNPEHKPEVEPPANTPSKTATRSSGVRKPRQSR